MGDPPAALNARLPILPPKKTRIAPQFPVDPVNFHSAQHLLLTLVLHLVNLSFPSPSHCHPKTHKLKPNLSWWFKTLCAVHQSGCGDQWREDQAAAACSRGCVIITGRLLNSQLTLWSLLIPDACYKQFVCDHTDILLHERWWGWGRGQGVQPSLL